VRITQEIIAEIERLEDRRGRITPELVLDAARDKRSVLHDCFDWDDTIAAERWRLEQSRELIRSVKFTVIYKDAEVQSVKYVRNPDVPIDCQGYISTIKIQHRSSADMIKAELNAIVALLNRAESLAIAKEDDLGKTHEKIASIRESVSRLINSL
jgi:hypothetical protein